MKNKIIESILKAEQETDKLYSSAKAESLKIVSKAEEENIKLKNSAQESSKKLLKQKTVSCEEKFKQEFENTLQGYVNQASELENYAEKNYDRAVSVILKKMNIK